MNITNEGLLFNKVFLSENQKFDDFLTDLLIKIKTCEFGDLHDSLVTDRSIIK